MLGFDLCVQVILIILLLFLRVTQFIKLCFVDLALGLAEFVLHPVDDYFTFAELFQKQNRAIKKNLEGAYLLSVLI